MKIKYQGYWASRKQVKKGSHSVSKWDTWNGTKYERSVENGKLTSKEVAEIHYNTDNGFEFIVFEEDEDIYPSVYVTILPKNKHVGVHFIDPGGRKYLTYLFTEVIPKEKLFLREIWYYHFTKEFSDQEDYRLHHIFDEEGNVFARKYDDKKQQYTDYEGKTPIDTRMLYEPYPEFGEYKGIITLDRAIPMIDQEERKYYYMDGTRYYKDNAGNLIEDPT